MLPTEQTPNAETATTAAQVVTETEVQEEAFDKDRAMLTIHKLREAEKEAKRQLKELAELKAEKQKRVDAELSETDRLKKQADDLAAQNQKLLSDILRRDVVAETGLPAVFADRLKGATKEEMLADAAEIMKAIPQAKPTPKVSATNPANAENKMTDDERRAFLGLRR